MVGTPSRQTRTALHRLLIAVRECDRFRLVSDEDATLALVEAQTDVDAPQDRHEFFGAARGWRLVRGCDSGDPVALSRLDALLVEAQRTTPEALDVLRLRAAYAERQWGQQRGTVILRSNTQLLEDLTSVEGLLPLETAVVTLVAGVERLCDDAARDGRTATLDQIDAAASDLMELTRDPAEAAGAARSFTRLLASVRDGHRALNDAVKLARARQMPEVLIGCLVHASRQSRLARFTSEHSG